MQDEDPEAPLSIPGENRFPSAREVTTFHNNADTDLRRESIHHTLGPSVHQAASGGHNHDGNNSAKLLGNVTLVGSRGGNAALTSVIAALVQLGATDSTTA